jgi:glycine/D-amino acid oxidase-like deaminating enzyme
LKPFDVAVIGGGILGTTCALELLERGRWVVMVERDEPGSGTAAGSAGYLADGEIFPVAQLRTIAALPRMLLDPFGPLVIRPEYAPRMIDWGRRFLSATRRGRFESGIRALASLNRMANDALFELATRSGAERYLVRDGALHVTRERSTLRHATSLISILTENGIAARAVERDELLKMEPNLSEQVLGGVFYPGAGRCTGPEEFGSSLAVSVREKGGTIVRADARALEQQSDMSWRVQNDDAPLAARRVVVAAGVWSRDLVRPLGYRVPLEAARGYHLMLPEAGVTLQRTLLIEEAHFCATPMENGVRLAGTVEFAGVDAPPNYARSDMLFGIASRYLPGLRADGATRWMGSRPSFPDSLPAIGAGRRHRNLYFCFGHEKLGLTQSAISARCIADLIAGESPPIDLSPFSLERFS